MKEKVTSIKYDESEAYPEIDEMFLGSMLQNLDTPTLLNEMYHRSIPLIKKITQRYIRLDAALDETDFLNQAYLALCDAMDAYRRNENGTKFSSVYVWYLQKSFEKLTPMNGKQVEISYPDGTNEIVSYKKYIKIKRTLAKDATTTVVNKYISLDLLIEDEGEKIYHDGRKTPSFRAGI